MTWLALTLYVVYLALAFGVRTVIQVRRTGSTGFHGLGGRPGSAEWLAGAGFAVALVLGFAAPVLQLAGVVEPLFGATWLGAVPAAAGIAATLHAQLAMGTSWRIGVDPAERTALVTQGPFALVRNPIFSAMIPTALGLTLLAPNAVAVVAFVALVLALELQVRVVEEPYLLAAQGEPYARYAARVGRFVPGVGRIPLRAS